MNCSPARTMAWVSTIHADYGESAESVRDASAFAGPLPLR